MSSNPTEEELDRSTTCPFLLRCYWRANRHNKIEDYRQINHDIYPPNEILMFVQFLVEFPLKQHSVSTCF